MGRYAKPCIVCGAELENVEHTATNQPHAGTCFTAHGQYGSTVFDPMNGEYLEINVCDKCVVEKAAEGIVLHGRDQRPVSIGRSIIGWTRADWALVEWDPGWERSDDLVEVESWAEFQKLRLDFPIESRFSDGQLKRFFDDKQRRKENV